MLFQAMPGNSANNRLLTFDYSPLAPSEALIIAAVCMVILKSAFIIEKQCRITRYVCHNLRSILLLESLNLQEELRSLHSL